MRIRNNLNEQNIEKVIKEFNAAINLELEKYSTTSEENELKNKAKDPLQFLEILLLFLVSDPNLNPVLVPLLTL